MDCALNAVFFCVVYSLACTMYAWFQLKEERASARQLMSDLNKMLIVVRQLRRNALTYE